MRNPTITDRQIDLLLDLEDALKRAFADNVVCSTEISEITVLVSRAKVKALQVHRGQIMAKNVMDNGEINANVLRQDRELKRDIALIEHDLMQPIDLAAYRDARTADSTA